MDRCELCGSNPCACPPITAVQRVNDHKKLPLIQQLQAELREVKSQLKEAEKVLKAIRKTSRHVQPTYLVALSREYFKAYGGNNGNI